MPHSARVQDYWLGGKDHYPADCAPGDHLLSLAPELADSVRARRYFLARAVRYLAGQGIRQFLDIGAGLPCVDSTREIAQRAAPGARVVYADNDPLVMAYARALLTCGPEGTCGHIHADLRDPDDVLAGAAMTLDLTRPVAILMLGVLTFVPDTGQAHAITHRLLSVAAGGSYLVISHPTTEVRAGPMTTAPRLWNDRTPAPAAPRARAELAQFLDGLDLIELGVVSCPRWRPDLGSFAVMADVPEFCAAGRKPKPAAST